jgi:hypothetical protein
VGFPQLFLNIFKLFRNCDKGNSQPLAKQLINVSLAEVGEVPTKMPDILNITVESNGRTIALKVDI